MSAYHLTLTLTAPPKGNLNCEYTLLTWALIRGIGGCSARCSLAGRSSSCLYPRTTKTRTCNLAPFATETYARTTTLTATCASSYPQDSGTRLAIMIPEFATFTYGDVGENRRSAALTKMTTGDALLFLARLEDWQSRRRTGQGGFYLIGGLLAEYAGWVVRHSPQEKRFENNAHPYRGDARFWGVAGSGKSRRFERAVPINREICAQVFRDASGKTWTWGNGRSELARIGSYTRACRCVLDTNDAEQRQRTATLREWIERYTGPSGAELLPSTVSS